MRGCLIELNKPVLGGGPPRGVGGAAGGRAALACRAAGLAGKPTPGEESQLEKLNVHSPDDFMKCREPNPYAALQPAAKEEKLKERRWQSKCRCVAPS